jgi:hypothetical protein
MANRMGMTSSPYAVKTYSLSDYFVGVRICDEKRADFGVEVLDVFFGPLNFRPRAI